jgi:hypothetical protein
MAFLPASRSTNSPNDIPMPTLGLARTKDSPKSALEGLPDSILDAFGERFNYLCDVFDVVCMIFDVWSPI